MLALMRGRFVIQITDQGKRFVNKVYEELHLFTGVQQLATSGYHSQSRGLVERQNRTIKEFLLKVLEENPLK